jgi:tRNA (uracil-5-)-methyltransferase TRM9
MEESIAARLRALNRRFYAEHAEDFAETRPRLAAGVRQVLARIAPGARVLEVGCGDGKVGRALRRAGVGAYVGVDESEAMVARASRFSDPPKGEVERRVKSLERGGGEMAATGAGQPATDSFALRPLSFIIRKADITEPGWAAGLPGGGFDWALAFAVLHHVPGRGGRAAVLKELAGLVRPGGQLAMSNWQFTRSERLLRRVRPWAEAELSEAEVEPGDFLLAWERGGRTGLRYVHLVDEAETREMAAQAGLRVAEVFAADGISGDLAQYVRLVRE